LWREIVAMGNAARAVAAPIITGDTKVVERGKCDGMFINTSGVGAVVAPHPIEPASVSDGDVILLSGDLGRHGMAVMAAREGFEFETTIRSDCGYVGAPVLALLAAGIHIHCLRDLTRGGLATALNEIASASGVSMHLDETAIPVSDDVRSACELFGFDPLYVANEGCFAAWVPGAQAEAALHIMRHHDVSARAVPIGVARNAGAKPAVIATNSFGASRVIDLLSGEQLPRIC
jgi:hydrogenase expression/formation protein HypE